MTTKTSHAKHVHFIGIAGSGMAPIAKMMRDRGWTVTGSEHNQVWEPMKSFLRLNRLTYVEEGVDLDNLRKAELVVIGGSALMANDTHPEFVEAKRLGKKLVGYGEILRDYIVRKNSVVVTGSYGKSTISAMLAWILDVAGLNPSFMCGAQAHNFDSGVRWTDSAYSVMEGDEYASVFGFDMKPRFMYYKPKYTLLTSAQWDHKNIYPTERSYVESFEKLAQETEKNNGIMLFGASGENNDVIQKWFQGPAYTYMTEGISHITAGTPDYIGRVIEYNEDHTTFEVLKKGEKFDLFESSLIGRHNVENCLAAIAMCDILGIDTKHIRKGIQTFLGVKRRLEIIGHTPSGAPVIDDFAHSPVKIKSSLDALRTRYRKNKLIIAFDPHHLLTFPKSILSELANVLSLADIVIIPRVAVKKSTPKDKRIYGRDIVKAISCTGIQVEYIPIDKNIISFIRTNADSDSVVVFMSSSGWKGVMEDVTTAQDDRSKVSVA